jgi:hypothetical protein
LSDELKIDARATGNGEENEELTWVPHWTIVRDTGAFTMNMVDVVWSTKHQAVVVKDADSNGCMFRTVHHADALYTDSMPDGVRFLRAVSRTLDVAGTPKELVDAVKAALPRSFTIAMVTVEDKQMRRFTID